MSKLIELTNKQPAGVRAIVSHLIKSGGKGASLPALVIMAAQAINNRNAEIINLSLIHI